jgi:hypothetical protein
VALLVLLMIWARLLTWVDKDSQDAHLPRIPLNSVFLCGMILGFVLFLMLPGFWVALGVFLVVMIAEIVTYLVLRSQKVGLNDLGREFNNWIKGFGGKEKEVKAEEGQVLLINKRGTPYAPPEADAPERAAFVAVQDLLTEPLRARADRAPNRRGGDAHAGDGMTTPPVDARDDGRPGVAFLKQPAPDLNDRCKPQTG